MLINRLGQALSFAKPIYSLTRNLLLLAGLLLATTANIRAQGDDGLEYKIKTAYLYNFTKFIEWPANNNASFNLCVIGPSPIRAILTTLENKSVLDKPIRIHYYDNIHQAIDCQIAYFEQLNPHVGASLSELMQAPQLAKVLTVGSQDLFAEKGGMIGFTLDQDKLKLHINLQAIKRQGLNISAKLIEVAVLVKGGEDD